MVKTIYILFGKRLNFEVYIRFIPFNNYYEQRTGNKGLMISESYCWPHWGGGVVWQDWTGATSRIFHPGCSRVRVCMARLSGSLRLWGGYSLQWGRLAGLQCGSWCLYRCVSIQICMSIYIHMLSWWKISPFHNYKPCKLFKRFNNSNNDVNEALEWHNDLIER